MYNQGTLGVTREIQEGEYGIYNQLTINKKQILKLKEQLPKFLSRESGRMIPTDTNMTR